MAQELDELTLARARQGEPSALTALVRQYEKAVFQLLGRLMCSRAPAAVDDVAQEAFIRVIRGIHRFDPRGPARLSTWILTVATRTCLNSLRGRNRDAPLDGHAAALEAADSPEQAVIDRERGRRIEAAMAVLPAEMRAVLVLRAYHDLDYPEIAAALDSRSRNRQVPALPGPQRPARGARARRRGANSVSANPTNREEFTAEERAALALWQAPQPGHDFAERVLARAAAERAPAAAPSGRLAVAALALILLGGLLSMRSLLGPPSGGPTHESPAAGTYDAGPGPEVREPFDGLERHPS